MVINISVTSDNRVYYVDTLAQGGRVICNRDLHYGVRKEVNDRRGYWFHYNQTRLYIHFPLGNGWHDG